MTDFDANRLLLMIIYNFSGFLPKDIQGAAVVKSTWLDELRRYDAAKAEKAVKTLITTCHFPPQIADFRDAVGVGGEYTREDMQARLPGPTFGTPEGYKAMYTASEEHMNAVMEKLMRDLG